MLTCVYINYENSIVIFFTKKYNYIDSIISSFKKHVNTDMEPNPKNIKDKNEMSYLCSLLSFERKNIIDDSQINPYLLSLAHRLNKKHIPKSNIGYDDRDIIM